MFETTSVSASFHLTSGFDAIHTDEHLFHLMPASLVHPCSHCGLPIEDPGILLSFPVLTIPTLGNPLVLLVFPLLVFGFGFEALLPHLQKVEGIRRDVIFFPPKLL